VSCPFYGIALQFTPNHVRDGPPSRQGLSSNRYGQLREASAGIADVPILSSPDKNNSALENLETVVNCVLNKEFSAHFSC